MNGRGPLAFGVLLTMAGCVRPSGGASSAEELATRLQDALYRRDGAAVRALVYKAQGQTVDSPDLLKILDRDMRLRVRQITVATASSPESFEYTRKGTRFGPALPPTHTLVVTFEPHDGLATDGDTYAVGEKDGRYYLTLPVAKP